MLLCACNNPVPKDIAIQENTIPDDYIEHIIELKNDLGQLIISLPPEFDTAYSWKYQSDIACEDSQKFRFANKKYSLPQESGMFYFFTVDSLYQFTVEQLIHKDTGIRFNEFFLEQRANSLIMMYEDVDFFIKEMRRINDRDFAVMAYKQMSHRSYGNYDKNNLEIELDLFTRVNEYPICLEFLCQAKDCTDFLNRVEKSLPSIKIQ